MSKKTFVLVSTLVTVGCTAVGALIDYFVPSSSELAKSIINVVEGATITILGLLTKKEEAAKSIPAA